MGKGERSGSQPDQLKREAETGVVGQLQASEWNYIKRTEMETSIYINESVVDTQERNKKETNWSSTIRLTAWSRRS